MTAVITGASSGIGRDIARELAKRGVRLIVSGRNREALEALREEIGKSRVKIITADLADKNECFRLFEESKKYAPDILINNAGFGLFGKFEDTDIEKEIEMINVNVTAVHILTKLFLREFRKNDRGYILNVASSAGFMPGPYMSTYYSTKSYVVRLTEALSEELRADGSKVYIGALCPGPVNTEFNRTAGVSFALNGISSEYAAKYAVDGMLERKVLIIPTFFMKAVVAGASVAPPMLSAKVARNLQKKKGNPEKCGENEETEKNGEQ